MTLTRSELTHYLTARRSLQPEPELHRRLFAVAPTFHLSQLRDRATALPHKHEILALALAAGGREQELLEALWSLKPAESLQVVDVVRLRRLNGRRAARLGLRFALGHPRFTELVATRRRAMIRLFKHCLGERTWSAVRRALPAFSVAGERFLRSELLRHAPQGERQREVWEGLCVLAGVPCAVSSPQLLRRLRTQADLANGAGLPRETLLGLRGQFHPGVSIAEVEALAGGDETRIDGLLTTLHKAVLEGREPTAAAEHVERRLDAIERTLSAVRGRAAVVLDQSRSMASSGERAGHPFALGVALTRLLQARCTQVTVHGSVPGVASVEAPGFPRPQGAADLAKALIAAARTSPQVVFVVTDGYENRREGDVAEVVKGMRQVGLEFPVYQVVPLFSASEDLSSRRLGDEIPVLAFAHEDEVVELAAHVVVSGSAPERVWPRTFEALSGLLSR